MLITEGDPMEALKVKMDSNADHAPAFLRVEASARGFRWIGRLTPDQENTALAIAQSHGVSEILARVLAGRGSTPGTVALDLNPTIKALMPDPSTLRDMDIASARFAQAVRESEKIAIFGDYDVDGATSVALIRRFLRCHGLDAAYYIPDRQLEGYGPNTPAFEQLVSDGARIIVTVDCGTVSHEPISRARELGAEVIILDHHQADESLPGAHAVVNPNRLDDVSGQGHLAAVGVVFLFLAAAARQLRSDGWYGTGRPEPDLMAWTDLAALGTVCDVVPLTGLNRALVGRGLEVMRARRNVGLRALADAAGLSSAPTTFHLGFVLGPRLNAGGRIGRSDLAAELLVCEDEHRAAELARELDRLNAERRYMQQVLQEEAIAQIEAMFDKQTDMALAVAQGDGWHRGLIGLAAARLTEHFARPSLVVSWDDRNVGLGSGRSIQGADLGAAVRSAVEAGLLDRGGGHAMAAGFTVQRDRAEAFFAHMEDALREPVRRAGSIRELKLDGALIASSATLQLMDELEKAGPFGAGNPAPRFAFAAHRCKFTKVVGEKHVKCSLAASNGARLDAISFNSVGTELGDLLLGSDGMPLNFAGHLNRSEWGGRQKVELHISDAAVSKKQGG